MIFYLVSRQHTYALEWFLHTWGKAIAERFIVMPYDAFAVERGLPKDASFIFSDLDRLSSSARAALGPVHDALVATYGPRRVLNDPMRSLLRFDLLRTLRERGINDFGVWRVGDPAARGRLPLFIREEQGFAESAPPRLETAADYDAAILSLEAQQVLLENLVAIEFCDTVDANGIYRKYGVFIAGNRIVPRHLSFSRSWFVKAPKLAEPAMLAEEMAFIEANPHADELAEIGRLANIAYGRIDYGIRDGRLQIWEINTNPVLSTPDEIASERRAVHERFANMISAAFIAIDSPH
jgi:hypothetical protein